LIADKLARAFPKNKVARELIGLALIVGEKDRRTFFEGAVGVHHLFELEGIPISGSREGFPRFDAAKGQGAVAYAISSDDQRHHR